MKDPQKKFAPGLADASTRATEIEERITNATVEVLAHLLDTLPETMINTDLDRFRPMPLRLVRAGASRGLLEIRTEILFCPSPDDGDSTTFDLANPDDWVRLARAFTEHDLIGHVEGEVKRHGDEYAKLADAIEALLK